MTLKRLLKVVAFACLGMLAFAESASAIVDNADSLYVGAGETYTLGGAHAYADVVRIEATGTLYVAAYDGSANTGYVKLTASTIIVDGTIDGDGRGFRGEGNYQEGPGIGSYPGGGGAYGGSGGASGHGGSSKSGYGTASGDDIEKGSGGGDTVGGVYGGGNGGGLIILNGTSVTVSGSITTNGTAGLSYTWGAGGASGGGIWIEAVDLIVSGALSARGGDGGSGTWGGGGGGGGRIKLFYCSLDDAASTVVVSGGNGGGGTWPGAAGGAGTYYTQFAVEPSILSILDVGNDQGRLVRVTWDASCNDDALADPQVIGYDLWRRIDDLPVALATRVESAGRTMRSSAYPPGDWDYVGHVPARGEVEYNMVAPTLADSNVTGMYYSVFFVSAVTADPFTYYDSAPDSGYSVDNLAPVAPTGFMAHYVAESGNELTWDDPVDADFQYFKIYRSSDPGFVPGPANLVHATIATSWTDVGVGPAYYKLSAVDYNGNEGEYASANILVGVNEAKSFVFALEAVSPNPARSASLNIEFSLPSPASARLELIDVAGRRLVSRSVGALGAGRHMVNLAQGEALPPGLYFIRLTQGQASRSVQVVVVD